MTGARTAGRGAGRTDLRTARLRTAARSALARMSLRTRLVLVTTGLLAVGLLLASVTVGGLLRGYLENQEDGRLRPAAAILSRTPMPQIALDPTLSAQLGSAVSVAVNIFDSPTVVYLDDQGGTVGELYERRADDRSRPGLPDLSSAAVAARGGRPFTVDSVDGDERWRVVAVALSGGAVSGGTSARTSGTAAAATVVVADSMDKVDATIGRLRSVSLEVGAGLLAVLAVIAWFAVRSGFRPLARIEETAAAIAGGDLTRRVPELGAPDTEVGQLSESLNGMLHQIELAFADRADSEARMRRFVADASHELRTPLVGIKGFTDLYRMGALPERDDVDRTMERIARESERLARLVENMLLLARLDERSTGGALPLDLAPTDLRTLAADALHDVRAIDPTQPVTLTGPDGGPPATAPTLADEARLRQVVTNLVGNATTHTPAGTPVRIGVGTADGFAVLEVADEGDGLTQEQARRVFERFYRPDSSRTRSAGGGAGLGLSIVQSLVDAHGGRVHVITSPGKGATFRVLLPLLPDSAPAGVVSGEV